MSRVLTDAALLARLAIPTDEFLPEFVSLIGNFPAREWTPESFAHGQRYPWTRPSRSFVLRDGEVALLGDLGDVERAALLAEFLGGGRRPLLAIGSNGAPRNLALKLQHVAGSRDVLVLAGALHDLDVVAYAGAAAYGAVPATLAWSPGTAVRAAVLLVTPEQLTALTWSEIPYLLGRLDGAPFAVDEGVELDAPLAFVARWGAFCPDGDPCPLAAIPADGRRWPAWTQRSLLDRVAREVPGFEDAEALTRGLFADAAGAAGRVLPALRSLARPFDFPGWTPVADDGTLATEP